MRLRRLSVMDVSRREGEEEEDGRYLVRGVLLDLPDQGASVELEVDCLSAKLFDDVLDIRALGGPHY